ncbi:MAG: hypothetical protein QXK37_06015 [Candidatus Woesearchaeota archaeon]
MDVFVFGSTHVPGDDFAIQIAKDIEKEFEHNKQYNFIYCTEPMTLLNHDEIVIMDVIKGISKVRLINDISILKERKISTLHDFDLGYFLKIAKNVEMIKDVKIIGIPTCGDIKEIKEDVKNAIASLS